MADQAIERIKQYYSERYDLAVRLPFVSDENIFLRDHETAESRNCRFCHQSHPEVSFKSKAHAVSEFLGNRSIFSLNECDSCNEFLGREYEDHLSKWSLFARAVSQIKGKKRRPTFKNAAKTMRVGPNGDGMSIELSAPNLITPQLREGGPSSFTLPLDATSQPYVPMRAALALVKIACSICPRMYVQECKPAIDWLMKRSNPSINGFPVLYSFTPGPISDAASEVLLLRRREDEPIPFMWCAVRFRNHQIQTFVPFCPSDESWLRCDTEVQMTVNHIPNRFGPAWPYGNTTFQNYDWSSTEPVSTSGSATFSIDRVVRLG